MAAGVPQGAPDSPAFFNISTLPFNFNFNELLPFVYSPWYCDDLIQAVISRWPRTGAHIHFLRKAISTQTQFERTRGIITCPHKSVIIPIHQKLPNELKVTTNGISQTYPVLRGTASTKILGLSVTSQSFTATHIRRTTARAKQILFNLYALQGLDIKSRSNLIKSLVIPVLLYPVAPLNTASLQNIAKIQAVQNRALKFIANVTWQDMWTARRLHDEVKFTPINQVIHNSAKKLWDKIESGIAADARICNNILGIPYQRPKNLFPSSHMRAQKPVPPPIFTKNDTKHRAVKAHYNSHRY